MIEADDDDMSSVAIGLPTSGVPMPRTDGFIGRLRRQLERLEVGMFVDLMNTSWKQEQYIRARMPGMGREMKCRFSIRVASNKRDRALKRTLRVWRLE